MENENIGEFGVPRVEVYRDLLERVGQFDGGNFLYSEKMGGRFGNIGDPDRLGGFLQRAV